MLEKLPNGDWIDPEIIACVRLFVPREHEDLQPTLYVDVRDGDRVITPVTLYFPTVESAAHARDEIAGMAVAAQTPQMAASC